MEYRRVMDPERFELYLRIANLLGYILATNVRSPLQQDSPLSTHLAVRSEALEPSVPLQLSCTKWQGE